MKKLGFTAIVVVLTAFVTSFVVKQQMGGKPKAEYKVGSAVITVWENQGKDSSVWKSFEVNNRYKKDGEWKKSNSFNAKDLLELRAVIDKVIAEEIVEER